MESNWKEAELKEEAKNWHAVLETQITLCIPSGNELKYKWLKLNHKQILKLGKNKQINKEKVRMQGKNLNLN